MGYKGTNMILEEDIRIKNRTKYFKKVITEKEMEELIEDILSDRYDI